MEEVRETDAHPHVTDAEMERLRAFDEQVAALHPPRAAPTDDPGAALLGGPTDAARRLHVAPVVALAVSLLLVFLVSLAIFPYSAFVLSAMVAHDVHTTLEKIAFAILLAPVILHALMLIGAVISLAVVVVTGGDVRARQRLMTRSEVVAVPVVLGGIAHAELAMIVGIYAGLFDGDAAAIGIASTAYGALSNPIICVLLIVFGAATVVSNAFLRRALRKDERNPLLLE